MAERIVVRSRKENASMSLDNGWWKLKNCNIVLRFFILSNCTGKGSSNLYPCTWENKLFCLFVIRLLEGGGDFSSIFHLDKNILSELSLCAHQYYAIKSVILIITNVTNMTNVTVWQNVTSVTKCDKCDKMWKVWQNVTKYDKM